MVAWEADLDDGNRVSGVEEWAKVDKRRVKQFRFVAPGEILAELPGTGTVCYRRRVSLSTNGNVVVWHVAGRVPFGPVIATDGDEVRVGTWDNSDPVFYRPVLHPNEGEEGVWTAHTTTARLRPTEVVLKSGARLKVR